MSVTLAKNAGFCFGVSRAVETVEKEATEGKKVVTLGPIIHNRHVVGKFETLGVGVIETPEEAPGIARAGIPNKRLLIIGDKTAVIKPTLTPYL